MSRLRYRRRWETDKGDDRITLIYPTCKSRPEKANFQTKLGWGWGKRGPAIYAGAKNKEQKGGKAEASQIEHETRRHRIEQFLIYSLSPLLSLTRWVRVADLPI